LPSRLDRAGLLHGQADLFSCDCSFRNSENAVAQKNGPSLQDIYSRAPIFLDSKDTLICPLCCRESILSPFLSMLLLFVVSYMFTQLKSRKRRYIAVLCCLLRLVRCSLYPEIIGGLEASGTKVQRGLILGDFPLLSRCLNLLGNSTGASSLFISLV
jgi:hypothetical protein